MQPPQRKIEAMQPRRSWGASMGPDGSWSATRPGPGVSNQIALRAMKWYRKVKNTAPTNAPINEPTRNGVGS